MSKIIYILWKKEVGKDWNIMETYLEEDLIPNVKDWNDKFPEYEPKDVKYYLDAKASLYNGIPNVTCVWEKVKVKDPELLEKKQVFWGKK